jgi:aarF domain-containing kinase
MPHIDLLSEGPAVWLAGLVALAILIGALRVHRPLRRAALAGAIFALGFFRYLGRRLRGEGLQAGPREWRLAFERLGPTYIKLGQIIASSTSLFPQRYVDEFRRCLDRVPPEPWPAVQETVRAALGSPPEALFREVSSAPLASASIAGVYAAAGEDDAGQPAELVIKVQRQSLPELVGADMRILGFGAGLLQRLPRVRNANPRGVVQEFDRTIHEELDFVAEAAHMEEWNRIMRELGRADVCAPRPVRRLCARTVLTMERLRGVRVDDVEEFRRRGYDQAMIEDKLIAGMHAWFQSMIRHGFFHGDVHAGNLLFLDDGRIGFLDFGIIGRFSRERRRQIGDYIVAFAGGDFRAVARVMARMGVVDASVAETNLEAFAADLEGAYGMLASRSLGEIDYAEILPKIMRVSLRHGTRLPDDFVLVTRQLLYFDRYAKLLAPSLNIFSDPRLILRIAGDLAAI